MDHNRPSIDSVLINVAIEFSKRSTCDRAAVGCVIATSDGRVLSTGYNGSAAGMPHCSDAGHIIDESGSCIRTIHAEMNAVAHAAKHGVKLAGAVAYCTHRPCVNCAKVLTAAGIARVVYVREYHAARQDVYDALGLVVAQFTQ